VHCSVNKRHDRPSGPEKNRVLHQSPLCEQEVHDFYISALFTGVGSEASKSTWSSQLLTILDYHSLEHLALGMLADAVQTEGVHQNAAHSLDDILPRRDRRGVLERDVEADANILLGAGYEQLLSSSFSASTLRSLLFAAASDCWNFALKSRSSFSRGGGRLCCQLRSSARFSVAARFPLTSTAPTLRSHHTLGGGSGRRFSGPTNAELPKAE